ncbi:MAG: cupin domain-containing protein [Burkholderiales bacterium]|nr:cupin domain-containing protein [Burkholderiales bacterium]
MDTLRPTALLGGLSPALFMRRHWQKKPLLVRGALADALPGFDRRRLFALAARDDVESRLVVRDGERWSLRPGPVARRALPPLAKPGWSLLVQGVDLHDDAAHRLLQRFRFVPDARLDDVMLSYASDGGGVGPHIDSYDVFLLQIAGQRRWRVGRVARPRLRDDVPLKMLAGFVAAEEWLLEPGDMLYLPPGWGHDGIAVGECITASIGFRAPAAAGLAADALQRIADAALDATEEAGPAGSTRNRLYTDRGQAATASPARIPEALQRFADAAVVRAAADAGARQRALGEALSEPKPGTWFERSPPARLAAGVVLDRRSRMLYDDAHVYLNGEAFRAGGRDATLMRAFADARRLEPAALTRLSSEARGLLARWVEAGWCRGNEEGAGDRDDE